MTLLWLLWKRTFSLSSCAGWLERVEQSLRCDMQLKKRHISRNERSCAGSSGEWRRLVQRKYVELLFETTRPVGVVEGCRWLEVAALTSKKKKKILLAIIFCSAVALFWAIISHSIRPTAHGVISSSQAPCMWSWADTFSWSKPHHSPLFQLPNLHLSPLVEKPLKKKKKKEIERSLVLCCFQRGIEVKRENQIRLWFGRGGAIEAAH